MVLGFTLSALAEKEQNKYYEKSDCGKGYECKADDCGVKKKGFCYENECKKGWAKEKNSESCWEKKKEPKCHYKKYVPPYCGKCHKRHDGYCKRDNCYGNDYYHGDNDHFDDGCYKKDCHRPYRKCHDDKICYEKGYKKFRECKIGCAAP